MTFIVTRQAGYGEEPPDDYTVQLSDGGWDHVGPGMLVEQYTELGEASEHDDPRAALEACIRVAEQWTRDTGSPKYIEYSYGSSKWIIPFDVETYTEGRARAEKQWNELKKCAYCDKPLPDNERQWWQIVIPGMKDDYYCSEYCANRVADSIVQDFDEDELASFF